MRVNVKKSEVMWFNLLRRKWMSVRLNGEPLEEVEFFRYLGVEMVVNGRMKENLSCREGEGVKVWSRKNYIEVKK